MNDMMSDKREIATLQDNQGYYLAHVGENGVTKIEAYGEPGEMSYVTWFAVWAGETLRSRVNSKYVTMVLYKRED